MPHLVYPSVRRLLRHVLTVVLVVSPALALVPTSTPPTDDTFEVYIAAGQSNMAALAAWTADVQQSNPRAHFRRRDVAVTWSNIPPRSSANTLDDLLGNREASGSYFFGWDMARAKPTKHIGVINLAVSGSSLSKWKKGGGDGQNYYADVIAAIADVQANGGVVKGMIWHQGEAGVGPALSGTAYSTAFSQFITDLRTDTGLGNNFLVVAGTINQDGLPTTNGVNRELSSLVDTLPNFALVSTRHRTMGDNVHYDVHAQHELGSRYSAAMRRLQGSPEPLAMATTLPTAATFGTWFELPHWWQVTGGNGDYITWQVVGSLPAGWTAQKDNKFIGGKITGTAPISVTVRATDSSGSVDATYTIQPTTRPLGTVWLSPTQEVGFTGSNRTPLAGGGKRILTIGEFGGNSNTIGTEELAYLQFDLSSIPANFLTARLEFEIAGLNKFYQYTGGNQRIAVRAVSTDTWSESNLVEPANGAELIRYPITNLNGAVTGPVSLDLTDYIRTERNGDQTASLALAYDRDVGFGGYLLLYSRRGLVPVRLVVTVPTTYATWTASIPWGTADNAPTADPDADGQTNLLEYAIAADPLVPTAEPVISNLNINSETKLQLSFLRARPDLTYEILASPDLSPDSWTTVATNPGSVSTTTPVNYTDTTPVTGKRFLRLKVTP